MKSGKIKTKSKAVIHDAVDIIRNTEKDENAVLFLRETIEDDFPDLDLGRMDLHEAIKNLGGSKEDSKSKSMKAIENLNKSLGKFLEFQEEKSGNLAYHMTKMHMLIQSQ